MMICNKDLSVFYRSIFLRSGDSDPIRKGPIRLGHVTVEFIYEVVYVGIEDRIPLLVPTYFGRSFRESSVVQ